MRFLRQNTAVIVTVGPFYDKGDGVTIEGSLTITNERITMTADTDDNSAPTNVLDNVTGATSGTSNDLNYITGNDAGMMQLELSAANTNRVGRMLLSITDAANHVPVFHEFFVLPQAIYDWLTGVVTPLPANVTQFGGSNITSSGGRPEVNTTHIAGSAVSTSSAQIGVNVVNAGGTAWGSGAITAASIAADAITAAKIANGAIDAATFAADVDAEILSYIVDDATRIDASALNTLSSHDPGEAIMGATDLGTGAGLTTLATQASVNAVDDFVDTEVAAIKTVVDAIQAKTDNLPASPAAVGSAMTLTVAYDAAKTAATQASVDAVDDLVDTEVAAIKTVVDAVKAKTDSLTFTVAGQVDANIQYVNDVLVNGDGQPGTEWGP